MGDDKAIYAYVREKGNKKVLVILNFSASEQTVSIKDATLTGKTHNVFKEKDETLTSKKWKMKPWGYEVYEY